MQLFFKLNSEIPSSATHPQISLSVPHSLYSFSEEGKVEFTLLIQSADEMNTGQLRVYPGAVGNVDLFCKK